MSSTIWTQCGGTSRLLEYAKPVWRVVEAQHQNSTRKLVDTDEEQAVLEDLIEETKPSLPSEIDPSLNYLLFTPFRYPPLRHGSRYRRATDPGVWYGAEKVKTSFAEVAYYRFVFVSGSDADLEPIEMELSAFATAVKCEHAIDVSLPPFNRHEALFSKTSYEATQALGAAMRADGVHVVRYPSARDAGGGACVGVFDPVAFGKLELPPTTYKCSTTNSLVVISGGFGQANVALAFERAQFEVDGALPSPAT